MAKKSLFFMKYHCFSGNITVLPKCAGPSCMGRLHPDLEMIVLFWSHSPFWEPLKINNFSVFSGFPGNDGSGPTEKGLLPEITDKTRKNHCFYCFFHFLTPFSPERGGS